MIRLGILSVEIICFNTELITLILSNWTSSITLHDIIVNVITPM